MPHVYLSDAWVPELGGTLHNCLAVVIHEPQEIEALEAICHFAPRPPAGPLQSLYDVLSDTSLDFELWRKHWLSIQPAHAEKFDPEFQTLSEPRSDVQNLIDALRISKQIWLRIREFNPPDAASLVFILFLGQSSGMRSELGRIESEKSAFVLEPGSIVGRVLKLSLKIPVWMTCFVFGGGVTPSARIPGYVKRLRARALQRPGVAPLRNISEVRSSDLKGQRHLTVLVHGLLSTDVGTFKELQTILEARNNGLVVGFPHDTLQSTVESNGIDLAKHIDGLGPAAVSIAAHSRGGLVARAAARRLSKSSPNLPRIRCATFGTPHSGAILAEFPDQWIGLAVMWEGLKGIYPALILDALSAYTQTNEFPGIVDLKPSFKPNTYLAQIEQTEMYPDDHSDLFVVGGQTVPLSLLDWVCSAAINRLTSDEPNDWIVPLDSSRPRLRRPESASETVQCNHFRYFEPVHRPLLQRVGEWLIPRRPGAPPRGGRKIDL